MLRDSDDEGEGEGLK